MLKTGDLVLFQGDSITDCNRHREVTAENHHAGLGQGYAAMAAARLLADRPGDGLRFRNTGIGGDRIVDLYARWREDALNLRPDVISILIGVNDTWHEHMRQAGIDVEKYARLYRQLLDETRRALPDVRLVLCEPFALPCGAVKPDWLPEMEQRREVVRELAGSFNARLVPFQAMFERAQAEAPCEYWAGDGVHPTSAGHMRMADEWIRCVQEKS
jgi:lysophospholipase L1-like esterase